MEPREDLDADPVHFLSNTDKVTVKGVMLWLKW